MNDMSDIGIVVEIRRVNQRSYRKVRKDDMIVWRCNEQGYLAIEVPDEGDTMESFIVWANENILRESY